MPVAVIRDSGEIGSGGRERLTTPFGGGWFFAALLADAAFAGGRFLHLGAHGAEIVGGRDYREENDEHASEGQQALKGSEAAARRQGPGMAPQAIGRQRQ